MSDERHRVEVVEYDPAWPSTADVLHRRNSAVTRAALGSNASRQTHRTTTPHARVGV